MSKVLLFADLHAHNWDAFSKTIETKYGRLNSRLYDIVNVIEQMGKVAKKEEVSRVVFLGDLFHKRGYVHTEVFNVICRVLGDTFEQVDALPGNHDAAVRNIVDSKDVSFERLGEVINLYFKPEVVTWEGRRILFAPYMDEGLEQVVEENDADIAFLHADIAGLSVDGYKLRGGISATLLKKYKKVFNGHIHASQTLSNITVVGAPIQHSFKDKGVRGCWILDLETLDTKFVPLEFPQFITVNKIEDVPKGEKKNFYRVLAPVQLGAGTIREENVVVQEVPVIKQREESLTLNDGVSSMLEKYLDIKGVVEDRDTVLKEGEKVLGDVAIGNSFAASSYRLKKMYLRNFMSYKEQEFEFTDGAWLLQGKNGAGKTSLFEGIRWALYGEGTKKRFADDVINWDEKEGCLVKLEFIDDANNSLTVEAYRKDKEKGNSFFGWMNGEIVEGGTNDVVRKNVIRQLGVSSLLYDKMVYFSQIKYQSFLGMTELEKKQFLTVLLGLDMFDVAQATMKEMLKETEKGKAEIEKEIEKLNAVIAEKEASSIAFADAEALWHINRKEKIVNKMKEMEEAEIVLQKAQAEMILKRSEVAEVERIGMILAPVQVSFGAEESLKAEKEGEKSVLLRELAEKKDAVALAEKKATEMRAIKEEKSKVDTDAVLREVSRSLLSERESIRVAISLCEATLKAKKRELVEYGEIGDICPVCKQSVKAEFKGVKIEEIEKYIEEEKKKIEEAIKVEKEVTEKIRLADKQMTVQDEEKKRLSDDVLTAERALAEKKDGMSRIGTAIERINAFLAEIMHTIETKKEVVEREAEKEARDIYEKKVRIAEKAVTESEYAIRKAETVLESKRKEKNDIENEVSPYTKMLSTVIEEKARVVAEVATAQESKVKSEKEIQIKQFWVEAFGNAGVKNILIDSFAREFNEIVNGYLEIISSGRTAIMLSTQTELQSKQIREKLEVVIVHDGHETDFDMISGGEGRRVDLGVLFALNEAARKFYGLEHGVLGFVVLDEIFAFLDAAGYETASTLINKLSENMSVFVISHSEEIRSYIDRVVFIEKDSEGSHVRKVGG